MRPFQDRKLDGSPRHRHAIGKISAQQSHVTNGRGLLPKVDHRSALARRLADVIASYREGLGVLDERQMALIKSAATCSVQLERMQAAIIRDEPVDVRLLVRLTNTQTRALQALGEAKEKAQAQPAGDPISRLRQHLERLAQGVQGARSRDADEVK
jgi:hypothetical protein